MVFVVNFFFKEKMVKIRVCIIRGCTRYAQKALFFAEALSDHLSPQTI